MRVRERAQFNSASLPRRFVFFALCLCCARRTLCLRLAGRCAMPRGHFHACAWLLVATSSHSSNGAIASLSRLYTATLTVRATVCSSPVSIVSGYVYPDVWLVRVCVHGDCECERCSIASPNFMFDEYNYSSNRINSCSLFFSLSRAYIL